MEIHVEALFTSEGNGRLRGINDPGGDPGPAPRFFFGRTREGSICRFRNDLPENVVTLLKEAAAAEPVLMDSRKFPRGHSQFQDILHGHCPVERVWAGPAYRFPGRIDPPANVVRLSVENAGVLRGNFAKMVPELDSGWPWFAVVQDSQAVSICQSVRSSWRAHEAGVDTLETYRQLGYAVSAVSAWALAVRELDLVPLYSTSWENLPSQRLARRLGLIQYGVDYHLT